MGYVPEGRTLVAQLFIAGHTGNGSLNTEETNENGHIKRSIVPSGLNYHSLTGLSDEV